MRLGDGDGGFGPVAPYPAVTGARGLVVGDVDADAKPDLAVAGTGGSAAVLLGDGDGGFAPAATFPAGTGSFSVAAAQLDGDGAIDLAVGNYGGDVSILRNVPEPALTLGPAGHGYGVQDVGTTSAGHTLTVTSTGNARSVAGR